jgi:hypothetical protein
MRNSLASLMIALATVLAFSAVACAQSDGGQAGQQPAANPGRGPRTGQGSKCPISHREFAVRSARFFRNMDGARRSL